MRILYAVVAIIVIAGCADDAAVEFGMNDEPLLRGTAGDLAMRVLSIEVPDGETYATVWEGAEWVQVVLQSSDFMSITKAYETLEPKSYPRMRITVDSLTHVQLTESTLIDALPITFIAQAFTPIVISGGDELRLVIVLGASVWFDSEIPGIKEGHTAFEGAALRVYYEY